MSITGGFFNAIKNSDGTYDRVYNSEQISDMFEGLVSDGVYESVGDALVVKQKSGMTVEVGTGRITLENKWIKNDAKLDITLASSHMTLPRWSAIVARVNLSNRTQEIAEKAGTPASSPVKPTMTNSDSVKEKCLAYVYVDKGATSISQMNITDTRADSSICGFVTGLVKQVDTSELFLQWQTAYEQFYKQMKEWQSSQKAMFDSWYSSLTQELNVNTYIQKFRKVVETTDQQIVFTLDMDGYTYESSDIIFVNINGIMLVETNDYLVNTGVTPVQIDTRFGTDAGNTVEIVVLKSKIGQA